MPKICKIFKSGNTVLLREYIKKGYIKKIKECSVLKYTLNSFDKAMVKIILQAGYLPCTTEKNNSLTQVLNLAVNCRRMLTVEGWTDIFIKILNLIIRYGAQPSRHSLTLAVKTRNLQIVQIVSKLSVNNLQYDERTLGYAFKSDDIEIVKTISNIGVLPYFNIFKLQSMFKTKNYDALNNVAQIYDLTESEHKNDCTIAKIGRVCYTGRKYTINRLLKHGLTLEQSNKIYEICQNTIPSYDFEYAHHNEKYDIIRCAIIIGCRPINPEVFKIETIRSWGQFKFDSVEYARILILFLCLNIDCLDYYSQLCNIDPHIIDINMLIEKKEEHKCLVERIKETAYDLECNTVPIITFNELSQLLFIDINCLNIIFEYYVEFVNVVPYVKPQWIRDL